jgi:hypothetical protein
MKITVDAFVKRAAAAACALVMLAGAAGAQSGRRPKGRTTPSPPPEMEPLPNETAPEPKEEAPDPNAVKLAAVRYLDEMSVPVSTANYVLAEAMKKLRTEGKFVVTPSQKMTTRRGAVDLAKQAKEEYVLFIEFQSDEDARGRYGRRDPTREQFIAAYYVFEPVSGKMMLSGQFFFIAGGTVVGYGGAGMPRYPGEDRRARGLTPAQAGERIANHILQTFLSRPVVTPRRI